MILDEKFLRTRNILDRAWRAYSKTVNARRRDPTSVSVAKKVRAWRAYSLALKRHHIVTLAMMKKYYIPQGVPARETLGYTANKGVRNHRRIHRILSLTKGPRSLPMNLARRISLMAN